MTGARHPRFLGREVHAGAVALRSRDRRPEVAARSGFAECQGGQMPSGRNVLQRLRDRGTRTGRRDRRGGADVHQIDHRDGRVRFGERCDDGRKGPRSQRRAADVGGQHDPQQSGRTERRDCLGRKSGFLVVLPCRRSENAIGDFFGIRNCGLVIHDDPRYLSAAVDVQKTYRTRSVAADDTRPASTDQHDRLRIWQAVAVSAAGAGIGWSAAITSFKAILLHHWKSLFS